ncbi:MAG: CvpA family protein [Acidobacteria bacterium]|nr:CvpA family protein [Acidobacteriota bacterium]
MNILDYVVLIVVLISTAFGALKGILKSLLSLASMIIGLIVAAYGYPYAAGLVKGFVTSERTANLLGFIFIFLLIIIAGSLLSRKLRGVLKRAKLDWVDHALGAAFGFLRAWLFCSVLYLALTAFPVRLQAVEKASFAPLLLEGTRIVSYLTSQELRDKFFAGYKSVKELWEQKH